MTQSRKIADELYYFSRFCEIAGLKVGIGTIRQLQPPQPDICCSIGGVERRFELTSVTDPVIEAQFGTGRLEPMGFKIEIRDVIDRISKKSKKLYVAGPSVELVLHEGMAPIDDLWLYDQQVLNESMMNALKKSPFGNIWLVDFARSICKSYSRAI